MADDPYFSHVSMLMNMNGTNGGTDAADLSLAALGTPTYNGDAQLSNAQTLYQATALLLDGAGDFLSFADNPDIEPLRLMFTGEIRFRTPSVLTGNKCLLAKWQASGNNRSFLLRIEGTALTFRISENGSSTNTNISGGTLSPDTDYEVAFDIDDAGDVRLYLDGALIASDLSTGDIIFNSVAPWTIGAFDGGDFFDGYIYEVRFTRDVARYQGAYTPTSETWPAAGTPAVTRVTQAYVTALGYDQPRMLMTQAYVTVLTTTIPPGEPVPRKVPFFNMTI